MGKRITKTPHHTKAIIEMQEYKIELLHKPQTDEVKKEIKAVENILKMIDK
jgi:hypothetical protein